MATSEKRGKEKVVQFCVQEFHCLATILKMNVVAERFSCELATLVAWKATSLFSLLFAFYRTKIYRICRVRRGAFYGRCPSVSKQDFQPAASDLRGCSYLTQSRRLPRSSHSLRRRATPLCHFHPRYFELKKGGWKKAPWAASQRILREREEKESHSGCS